MALFQVCKGDEILKNNNNFLIQFDSNSLIESLNKKGINAEHITTVTVDDGVGVIQSDEIAIFGSNNEVQLFSITDKEMAQLNDYDKNEADLYNLHLLRDEVLKFVPDIDFVSLNNKVDKDNEMFKLTERKVKLVSKETEKNVPDPSSEFLTDQYSYDFDRYVFEDKSMIDTKYATVVIDFQDNTITAHQVVNGKSSNLAYEDLGVYLETLTDADVIRNFEDVREEHGKLLEGHFKRIEDGLIQYELDEFIDPSGDNDLEFVNNEIKKIPKLEKDSVVYLYHTELGDHHSFDFQATLYMESLELHKEASNEFFSVEEVIKYDDLYELANDVENYNSSDLSYFNEHDIDELEGVYLELIDMEEKGISFEADSYLKEFQNRKLNSSKSKDNGMEM